MAPSLSIRDGGGQPGRPQQGDQIIVTFSMAPAPSAFCSAWSASSFPDLVDPNVVVHATHGTGNDMISSVADVSDCATGFHFGSIDLGQTGYFSGNNVTFGGGSALCNGAVNVSGCTRIHFDGARTLTITLGQESNGQPTQNHPSVAVYTPDPALGVPGTISSLYEAHF
jgi:hypothetical protein